MAAEGIGGVVVQQRDIDTMMARIRGGELLLIATELEQVRVAKKRPRIEIGVGQNVQTEHVALQPEGTTHCHSAAGLASLERQQRVAAAEVSAGVDPHTLVSWNCNGLMSRLTSNLSELHQMVVQRDPCVVCIQEARVKAYCRNPKAKVSGPEPRERDRAAVEELDKGLRNFLSSHPLTDYSAHWSLANGRTAGELELLFQLPFY